MGRVYDLREVERSKAPRKQERPSGVKLWEVGRERYLEGRDIRYDNLAARRKLLATGVWEDEQFPSPNGNMVMRQFVFYLFFFLLKEKKKSVSSLETASLSVKGACLTCWRSHNAEMGKFQGRLFIGGPGGIQELNDRVHKKWHYLK